MIVGGVLEWLIGNTFPSVVFTSFGMSLEARPAITVTDRQPGAFWLTFGGTLQPFYNAYGAYSTTSNPAEGLETVGFNASFGKSVSATFIENDH